MFKLEIVMYNKDSKMKGGAFNAAFKALRTVLRLGSFTKAAHALGYTQSSISQMMASLEEELSFKLLIRSRNGITLTQEGQQLYPFWNRSSIVTKPWKKRPVKSGDLKRE